MTTTHGLGIAQKQLQILKTLVAAAFTNKKSWKVWVFGSRARGNFKPYSDIDLLIESDPPLTSTEKAHLASALEDSDLIYKVDLVAPDEVYAPYCETIAREKTQLWESP